MSWIKKHQLILAWIGTFVCILTLIGHLLIMAQIRSDLNALKYLRGIPEEPYRKRI